MKRIHARRRTDLPAANQELDAEDLSRLLPGLSRLAEVLLLGRARREDASRHALSTVELAAFGLSPDDCRGLVACGLLEIQNGAGRKTRGRATPDQVTAALRPSADSRFVLTDTGLAVVTRHTLSIAAALREATVREPPASASAPSPRLPRYDMNMRELSVFGQVILRLPAQAHNLAAVLARLELAGWKPRVANPLDGRPGGNEPRRLATAAYNLNDRQDSIDFHADDGALRWNWRHPRPTTLGGPRSRKPRS